MPFVILAVAIVFIIASIGVFKLHPFLALVISAVLVGMLSWLTGLGDSLDLASALELTAEEFGSTAGAIGIVIVLAAVIGQALLKSGAADKITRVFLRLLGEERAAVAFMSSGYFLSIPVFFDTVFFLLVPLARSLYQRTRRNYVLYVVAICAGAAVTHTLVPPTPGPLIMVESLPGLDLGVVIIASFFLAAPPALAGLLFAGFINRRFPIPARPLDSAGSEEDMQAVDESELPGFWASAMPVILPVALITGRTFVGLLEDYAVIQPSEGWLQALDFLGNKNFALLAATFFALWILKRQRSLTLSQLKELVEPAVMMGGMIVMITSAGGALGKMLARTGISEALGGISGEFLGTSAVFYILLAWLLAALLKTAQGSSTVAIITVSGIFGAMLSGDMVIPCHMIYIFSAIGFGSLVFSWMNDSGFWVVCKMSGFTERETLSTWTVLLFVLGVVGLVETLLLSSVLPLK